MDNTPPIDLPSLSSTIKGTVTVVKDILPWLMVLYNMVFGFGVKQSTSDHNQETLMQDHATLQELRTTQGELAKHQSSLEGKVDLLIKATFERGLHDGK